MTAMSLPGAVVFASLVLQAGTMQGHDAHPMSTEVLPGRWRVMAMAQAFPIFTTGESLDGGSVVDDSEFYLTQPAAMVNIESPGGRFTLRVTPNFEGLTLEDGELTFGGWGEGFIDRRHPHTLLHEAMLSVNFWRGTHEGFSISAGKGFAPYGTDDPMSRPSIKYPTNHHLAQILERFTVNAVLLRGGWGVEAGVFGGSEPEGPYDLSNVESFGDSWSARVSRRFGSDAMGRPVWEVSGSYGRVAEEHSGEKETTALYNGALRYDGPVGTGERAYALLSYSTSTPADGPGVWSLMGEASVTRGAHLPYLRVEHATRPEYPRGATSGLGFFHYDHDAEPVGATRWTIASLGWGYTASTGAISVRPFIEAQVFSIEDERGPVGPTALYGDDRFASLTIGARLFFGGGPMRMGSYGVLDAMTRMGRAGEMAGMVH